MPDLDSLQAGLRDRILKRLNLGHVDPTTVTADTVLFGKGEGLELDSLDALELTVMIEEEYGIVIDVAERNRVVFGKLGDLAAFIGANLNRNAQGKAATG